MKLAGDKLYLLDRSKRRAPREHSQACRDLGDLGLLLQRWTHAVNMVPLMPLMPHLAFPKVHVGCSQQRL